MRGGIWDPISVISNRVYGMDYYMTKWDTFWLCGHLSLLSRWSGARVREGACAVSGTLKRR